MGYVIPFILFSLSGAFRHEQARQAKDFRGESQFFRRMLWVSAYAGAIWANVVHAASTRISDFEDDTGGDAGGYTLIDIGYGILFVSSLFIMRLIFVAILKRIGCAAERIEQLVFRLGVCTGITVGGIVVFMCMTRASYNISFTHLLGFIFVGGVVGIVAYWSIIPVK